MNDVLYRRLRHLFDSQLIAVLSTSKDDQPYVCLVSFVVDEEMDFLIFSTRRNRLKYHHIEANPRVSLIIDDRRNIPVDLHEATSVTIFGIATDTKDEEKGICTDLLLSRHQNLTNFVNHPDTAVIKVDIEKMYVVSDFESVKVVEA